MTQSYAQDNEDLLMDKFLVDLGKKDISYVDIGAGDPIIINNTYYFYQKGFHGVLVDPLPWNCKLIREKRPRDILIEGVIYDGAESEVYVRVKGRHGGGSRIVSTKPPEHKRQVTASACNINDVLDYFRKIPDLVSIDAEGYDLTILKSMNLKKRRIPIICVETEHDQNIVPFMTSNDYKIVAKTRSNTIFMQ
jgi:FkbM family methyltransferase